MQKFDLCVIGSGSGNSLIDESLGDWSVALVDDGPYFGGTCLNAGCIPTKMFVYPADVVRIGQTGGRVDVDPTSPGIDWPALRERVFGRTDTIAEAGEDWRRRGPGVTLFRETAHFIAPKQLLVGGQLITADRFVIAAGSRPVLPDWALDLPDDVAGRVHTSDTILRLPQAPASLVIVGSGFIAAEMAHVFSAAGAEVTVLARGDALLRHADAEISSRFTDQVTADVTLRLGQQVQRIEASEGGCAVLTEDVDGVEYSFEAECVLVAVGRTPNADRLQVANAGVEVADDGYVVVDEFQHTTAEGVWALGDVCSRYQLKHVANHEARVVKHNLLHPDDPIASDHRFVPHAVFADPQIATVGLTEAQARDAGLDVAVTVQEFADVAYGWAMNDTSHCVKLIADRATNQLVGCHIIGPQASILIQPAIQAMSFGLDVPTMARGQYWIHPALTEVLENALLGLDLKPTR